MEQRLPPLAWLPDLGDHANFIWASYAIMFFVLGALVVWLFIEGRSLERRLTALEDRTGKRNARSK